MPSIQFMHNTFGDPEVLELPTRDNWEYIRGWPSGYGFREIAMEFNARGRPLQLITLDLGGQQRLSAYLPPRSPLTPVWKTPEEFSTGLVQADLAKHTLLVLDHPKDDNDLDVLELDFHPLQTYLRPGGESWLTVYKLEIPNKGKD